MVERGLCECDWNSTENGREWVVGRQGFRKCFSLLREMPRALLFLERYLFGGDICATLRR